MSWRVITYRLPAEPSRHRVAVWRELRRLGAVALQQGTWAVPDGERFETGFTQVAEAITAAGGKPVVLAVADEEDSAAQLEELFTAQREAEWGEFVSDCGKYQAELASEVDKGKLTLAELDEEDQSLDRLRRWYRTIKGRDLFGAPAPRWPSGGSKNAPRRWKTSPSASTRPGNGHDEPRVRSKAQARRPPPRHQPTAQPSR